MSRAENKLSIALVTGASSGLGLAFAQALDRQKPRVDQIWLVASDLLKLSQAAALLQGSVRLFALDLSRAESVEELALALRPGVTVRFFVNNAGVGVDGRFADQERALLGRLLDLNVRTLMTLCHAVSPALAVGSQVFNVASVAAFMPQPGMAVYAASKASVVTFSRALWAEWRPRGITVTTVCPGPMKTGFFSRHDLRLSRFKRFGLEKPERVVASALKKAQKGRSLSISSLSGKGIYLASRLLPTRFLFFMMRLLGVGDGSEGALTL